MSTLLSLLSLYQTLAAPADGKAAEIGLERWRELAADTREESLAARMRALADDAAGRSFLAAIFGNSPYLTQTSLLEPEFLLGLVEQGPDESFAALIAGLRRDVPPDLARPATMAALRVAKRRAALVIALADLAGCWTLDRVTGALSEIAEISLTLAAHHLLHAGIAAGEIAPKRIEENGLIVLGMGKLGAHELNYSSDVDLILLFDADRARYGGKRGVQHFFTALSHDLVRMMSERTEAGYVFRTDLRLRPDPGATPPAVSVPAALAYYESAGQNWERAAMIKARPVAGDIEAGRAFLDELKPFLWRRNLDFAAIQDIHSIKRQINAHRGDAAIAVAGQNIKLGRGGIREIEFFVQTQQLIWGGRRPELRLSGTLAMLDALKAQGFLAEDARATLAEAYVFLRRLEHRLQMIDDAQTHSVPADPAGLRRIAILMGYATADEFAEALRRRLAAVESTYVGLFEGAPSLAAPGNLVFTGAEDDPETLKTLSGLGFADPAAISEIIRVWHHGRYRATRSQRARELLTELVPGLLASFGATPNPDTALIRFDRLLAQIPSGVQFFSLFYNNRNLLDLIAEIMGAGTRLAEGIRRRPILLDAVMNAEFFEPLPPRATLVAELDSLFARAAHYEEILDIARRWAGDRKFQIGVQLLRRRLNGEEAGGAFADIAETAISRLLPRVAAEFAKSHGMVEGGALAVLGLGKLGSREMTVTSDLDLILVYDAPDSTESSQGPRPLAITTYYARLSQRFVNALTSQTSEGGLYDVDMRLRPSGSAGPIAGSLAAFRRYHEQQAWTWEHMALTRCRVVAGADGLAAPLQAEIASILRRPRDPATLALEVDDMRKRIADEHRAPHSWDAKHRRGGLVDIEFVAQFLQLRYASQKQDILNVNTRQALGGLAAAGVLDSSDAAQLVQALDLWRNVQGLVKLTAEEPFEEEAAPLALKAILAAGTGAVDFAALKEDMEASSRRALAIYERLIAVPAAAERAKREAKAS